MNEVPAVQKQLNNPRVQEKFNQILDKQGSSFVAGLSTLLTNRRVGKVAGIEICGANKLKYNRIYDELTVGNPKH